MEQCLTVFAPGRVGLRIGGKDYIGQVDENGKPTIHEAPTPAPAAQTPRPLEGA